MKQKRDAAIIRETKQIRLDFEAIKKRMGEKAIGHPDIEDIEKRLPRVEAKLGIRR